MKIKSTIIAGFLAFTSCANQAEPFVISKFYPVGAGCDGTSGAAKTAIVVNGYLDVAAGAPQYFLGIKVSGGDKITQSAIKVGSVELERENRNAPIIRQQVVTYRLSKRVGAAPKPFITNVVLPFSENGEVFGVFQLISPDLGAALFDGLSPSPGTAPSGVIEDFVDISADIEFKGEFSATRAPFTTGVLTFPIRAYRSNPVACANGFVKFGTDPSTPTMPDFCDYVGQSISQVIQPPVPFECCTAVGPSGGAGC